jgi:hypothetical protein
MASYRDLLGGRKAQIYKGIPLLLAEGAFVVLHSEHHKDAIEVFPYWREIPFCQFNEYSLLPHASVILARLKKTKKTKKTRVKDILASIKDVDIADLSPFEKGDASSASAEQSMRRVKEDGIFEGREEKDDDEPKKDRSEESQKMAGWKFAAGTDASRERPVLKYNGWVYRLMANGFVTYNSEKWLTAIKTVIAMCYHEYCFEKYSWLWKISQKITYSARPCC